MIRSTLLFATVSLVAAIQSQAQAPAPAQEVPETEMTVRVLGEIVPSVQDLPVSATAFDSQQLELNRIFTPQDALNRVPNVSSTDSGTRTFGDVISARGLTNTVFFGAPSTTFYVDDVPFGETFTYMSRFSAPNEVEVYRGPQPTQVGRFSYGGLINVKTIRPTNDFSGTVSAELATYGQYDVGGFLSGPLAKDKLFFRLGASYIERNGFLYNSTRREDEDDISRFNGNISLYWLPAPGWDISVTGNWDADDDGGPRLVALDRPDFWQTASDIDGAMQRQTNSQAIRVAYENEQFKFLSVTSRREWEIDPYLIDLDFTAQNFGSVRLQQQQTLYSQEFRFGNNNKDAVWDWNVGAYGSTSEIEADGDRNVFGFVNNTTHEIDEDTAAVFGSLVWKGVDKLRVKAGLRYDYVQRDLKRNVSGLALDPATGFPVVINVPEINRDDNWSHVTPEVGVEYDATDDVTVFARSTYAFKPGGFSAYSSNPAFVDFDEEKAWTFEAGVKAKWMEGRLQTNLTAFYYDIEDYQVERSFTPTDYAVVNAEEASSYGVEFEVVYKPNDILTFDGGIGWNEVELEEYTDPATGADLSGNEPPFVPEFTAHVGATVKLKSGFFARVEYIAKGDTQFDDLNREQFEQEAYGVLNASVGWQREGFTVQVFGTNITEEEYYTTKNTDVQTGAVGEPAQFGVRVRYDF